MGRVQKIGRRATRISNENGITRVRYHATNVVTFDDETIILDSGGWCTATTKARMNQTADQYGLGFHVYQEDWIWFVETKQGIMPFERQTLTIDRATMRPAGMGYWTSRPRLTNKDIDDAEPRTNSES